MSKPGHFLVISLTFLAFIDLPGLLAKESGNQRQINYSIRFHSGTVLPHHKTLAYLNQEYIRSLELTAWFDYIPGKGPDKTIMGAGYICSNLGNRNIYGNFHSIYFSILREPLIRNIPVQLQTSLGAAWATKKFDLENNFFNRAIGSHINAYGQINLTGEIPLAGEKWIFRPGITFHHISNGRIVSPNQGLNMLTIHAGFDFKSDHRHSGSLIIERDRETYGISRFSLIFAPGIKDVDRRINKQILTTSIIFDYGYIFRPERSVGLGIAFFYNDTRAYIPYTRTRKDDSILPFQSAIHLSLQRDKGPLGFFLHPGVYIYNQARDWPYMTNRLGMKYSFANNLTLQFSIKAHWFAIADYFEWGIGYEIKH